MEVVVVDLLFNEPPLPALWLLPDGNKVDDPEEDDGGTTAPATIADFRNPVLGGDFGGTAGADDDCCFLVLFPHIDSLSLTEPSETKISSGFCDDDMIVVVVVYDEINGLTFVLRVVRR